MSLSLPCNPVPVLLSIAHSGFASLILGPPKPPAEPDPDDDPDADDEEPEDDATYDPEDDPEADE